MNDQRWISRLAVLSPVAWVVTAALAGAYPPAVGILGGAKSCLSCHVSNGPWKDDAGLIIDVLDKASGKSLKQTDGGFLIQSRRGETRAVLTVIGLAQGAQGPRPYRNAWLYVDPRLIADGVSLNKFAPGWDVNLPMSCRLVGDASPAYPGAHITVLPMTVRPGVEAEDTEVQLQVMLTSGEAVKGKPREGMAGSYFERQVRLRVLPPPSATPANPAAGGGAQTSGLPDFELSDLDDKRFKLSDALATDVVVLWFTNFCPGCQASFPKVNSIADRLAGHDVSFVAVSILGSDTSTPRAALSKTKLAARVLLDATGEVGERFTGVRNQNVCPLNNLFIIDHKGTVTGLGHFPGGVPAQQLEAKLKAMLAQQRGGEPSS